MLRGSTARVAPTKDRGSAGEKLGDRAGGRRLQLRGQRDGGGKRTGSPEGGLPVRCAALHRARAVRREATPVGREAASPATGE